ncbi:MAG: DUF3300 domain-containing protein [Aquisalimonadaceae bacterium]
MKALARMVYAPVLGLLLVFSTASAQNQEAAFSQAELDQMLAPIALYPDVLLSQVLMASTYPLEVVEAARWSRANSRLEGADAVEAVADRDWDASVKALTAFPDLLARMSDDLNWISRLGDAYLLQEDAVADTIQGLRQRAEDAGSLDSLDYTRAYRDDGMIVIEPRDPRIIYVPYYRPALVYGGWWHPGYDPVYWAPPPVYYYSSVFYWGAAVRLSSGFFYSNFDWHRRHIVIVNVNRQHAHHPRYRRDWDHARVDGRYRWRHDAKHRRGVTYRNSAPDRDYRRSGNAGITQRHAGRPQGQRERDAGSTNRRPHASSLDHGSRRYSGATPQRGRPDRQTRRDDSGRQSGSSAFHARQRQASRDWRQRRGTSIQSRPGNGTSARTEARRPPASVGSDRRNTARKTVPAWHRGNGNNRDAGNRSAGAGRQSAQGSADRRSQARGGVDRGSSFKRHRGVDRSAERSRRGNGRGVNR